MDKYECITLFARTAQLGSFTAAADEQNLTQSAVSKKIAWLENSIGFTLFYRNSRKISLTPQGAEYLIYCIKLLDEMTHTESRLKGELTQVSGELKLSVPSAAATILLAEPISQFMTMHPNLVVNVSVNDQQVDLIESSVDIAIRASYLEDSGYKARLLFTNEAVCFASPQYLANKPTPKTINDLKQLQCLTYSFSSPSNIWGFKNTDGTFSKVAVRENFKSDSAELLLEMALLGHGVALLPCWMVEQYLSKAQLTLVLTEYEPMKLPMYAVFKANDYQPQRITSFVSFLANYFQERF